MNTKVLLATLAGGLVSFFLGWLIFGILLDAQYKSMMTPEALALQRGEADFIIWAIVLSNLAYSLMLAVVYNRWANISTFQGGAIAGAVISFLIALSFDLGQYSMFNMWKDSTGLIIDPLANGLFGALIGGIIGWVLGYGNKP
ncbi:MAG: hypothetical protein Q7T20_09335 [Saprospiraceae bacterium]|nr:hypothetical protein [Saprospiraceae bacterium]